MPTSNVSTYIADKMRGVAVADAVVDRLTVPLREYDHFLLVWLAERIGASQTGLSADLLRLAIAEAVEQLRPGYRSLAEYEAACRESDDPVAIAEQWMHDDAERQAAFDSELYAASRRWLEGGKKPPRPLSDIGADEIPVIEPKLRTIGGER